MKNGPNPGIALKVIGNPGYWSNDGFKLEQEVNYCDILQQDPVQGGAQ